jgi:hypothetical protein
MGARQIRKIDGCDPDTAANEDIADVVRFDENAVDTDRNSDAECRSMQVRENQRQSGGRAERDGSMTRRKRVVSAAIGAGKKVVPVGPLVKKERGPRAAKHRFQKVGDGESQHAAPKDKDAAIADEGSPAHGAIDHRKYHSKGANEAKTGRVIRQGTKEQQGPFADKVIDSVQKTTIQQKLRRHAGCADVE